jgi:hypothetical protein
LTSALDGGEWSISRNGRFAPGDRIPLPITQEAGWTLYPVWTLWSIENSVIPTGNRIPAFQPVARLYTEETFTAFGNYMKIVGRFQFAFKLRVFNGDFT